MSAAVSVVAVLGVGAFTVATPAASAAEPSPWWNLNTSVRPSTIPTGGEGTIAVRANNVGNSCTARPDAQGNRCSEEAEAVSSTASLTLPPGTEVVTVGGVPQVSFFAFSQRQGQTNLGPTGSSFFPLLELCKVIGPRITCGTESPLTGGQFIHPLAPYEFLEIRARVKDQGAAPGARFEAEAAGGTADPVTSGRLLPIGPDAPAFGAEEYSLRPEEEGGGLDARAGSHPYQLTTTFNLDQSSEGADVGHSIVHVVAPAGPRNLAFALPAGQIGNAAALPRCSALDFAQLTQGNANLCPPSTAIGAATVNVDVPGNGLAGLGLLSLPVPLFNLEPAFGEPARFGFEVQGSPVILDTSVRSGKGEDYGVTVSTSNVSQLVNFISSTVTFWGTPGDPSHDNSRGWSCLAGGPYAIEAGFGPCEPQKQAKPSAFLTLPTDCAAPFATSVSGESWTDPERHPTAALFGPFAGADPFALSGCNQLPFAPIVHSEPTSNSSTSATGLNFDIDFEDSGLLNPEGRAQSQLKKAVVSLPQGFTANPSVAEGLKACTEAEYESATVEVGSGCTEESKVGEVEVTSPLVQPDQILTGGLYVAKQHDNPNHNLLTLYLIARNAEIGTIVKQALKVTPDPVTGQLTTEVDDVPQLPFSHFHLSFRQGQRSPLITPPACGPYSVKALLYPWSNPTAAVERTSSFQITQGPEGQGCPGGGVPPFHPVLEAGTQSNAAGTYSPFYTRISRKDSEQEITHFSIKLPPGLSGKLAGVAKCSNAEVAAAKAREHELGGAEELEHPSCPANSEVGHTLVGTGVGNVLAYAPGKLYLAGPYKGSQISIVSITAAKVGPFDLGTVVIREGLKVNPETAQVSVDAAGSDPIPHIVDGIPVHLRDIRIYVDRPSFTINPTSCTKMSTAATVLGSGQNFASESDDVPVTVTSPFQAADCASLGFKPKLALSLKGGTKRGGLPKLTAVVTYPKGGAYANIAQTVVTLPPSEFLEQGHIGSSCTRVQFNAGGGNGEQCPAKSILGHAKAITPLLDEPVEGLVYLRSNGGERKLPDLVAALHSEDININLVGFISSLHKKGSEVSQIRNTFAAVPDQPVSKFTLELFGGKKGLLVNSTNICKGTHKAISEFTGQNGKLYDTTPAVKAQCGKKGKHSKKGGKSKSHGKGK